jgi:tRNA-splicing ligase RtcB
MMFIRPIVLDTARVWQLRNPAISNPSTELVSGKAVDEKVNWKDVNRFLQECGAALISAGLDDVPRAYKSIREVMAAQSDLIGVLSQFDLKLVKMAPSGERPED